MTLPLNNKAFWDVDMKNIDEENNADFIIARVFQYGLLEDLKVVVNYYNKDRITNALKNARGIDTKALALAKVLGY